MRSKFAGLIGKRFGRCTVIKYADKRGGNHIKYRCRCDCGTIFETRAIDLCNGHTASCGCITRDILLIRNKTTLVKHNRANTQLYNVWANMKTRCNNKNAAEYHNYGGRGIKVCPEWENDFSQFLKDMGERPNGGTIDRIDVNGDYTPENCRWATAKQQNRNRRNNHKVTAFNETLCLVEWAERLNMKPDTLRARLVRGWALEDIIQLFNTEPNE